MVEDTFQWSSLQVLEREKRRESCKKLRDGKRVPRTYSRWHGKVMAMGAFDWYQCYFLVFVGGSSRARVIEARQGTRRK